MPPPTGPLQSRMIILHYAKKYGYLLENNRYQSCWTVLINDLAQQALLQRCFMQENISQQLRIFCPYKCCLLFILQNPMGEGLWRKEKIWKYCKRYKGNKFDWNWFSSVIISLHGVFPQWQKRLSREQSFITMLLSEKHYHVTELPLKYSLVKEATYLITHVNKKSIFLL